MKPIKMPHSNRNFTAPERWDQGKYGVCEHLPVTEKEGILYSYWKLSLKEWFQILIGRPIRLSIISETQPPVMLDCED
jgi:hypothetical protein